MYLSGVTVFLDRVAPWPHPYGGYIRGVTLLALRASPSNTFSGSGLLRPAKRLGGALLMVLFAVLAGCSGESFEDAQRENFFATVAENGWQIETLPDGWLPMGHTKRLGVYSVSIFTLDGRADAYFRLCIAVATEPVEACVPLREHIPLLEIGDPLSHEPELRYVLSCHGAETFCDEEFLDAMGNDWLEAIAS